MLVKWATVGICKLQEPIFWPMGHPRWLWSQPCAGRPVVLGLLTRAAYRHTSDPGYRYYLIVIPIQGIEMIHSKRYSKSIPASGIWEKSNNNITCITKYGPANHKIPVYSNRMKKFDMWTLPSQTLWQLPLHIFTAQAVAVVCVWCSWWKVCNFQWRITSFWIKWLCGYYMYHMDRIDIGIKMWYKHLYRYRKICNDMQPYSWHMMTSSNGNIFRVTGHLCGKFTGPRWISRTKASDAELWCFLWFTPE